MASSRPCERNIGAERLWQNCGIDLDLRNVSVRSCVREKFAVTFVDENVVHSFFERGVKGVTVQIPIPADEIDLDAAAQRFAAVDAERALRKSCARFRVAGRALDD